MKRRFHPTAIQLKPKTSSGIDEISTKLLMDTVEKVIEPIAYIINKSLDTGIIPDYLKIAKVIPIYKSSDQSLKYYRPISLLAAFSKLLEKIMYMYDKLMSLLYKGQGEVVQRAKRKTAVAILVPQFSYFNFHMNFSYKLSVYIYMFSLYENENKFYSIRF